MTGEEEEVPLAEQVDARFHQEQFDCWTYQGEFGVVVRCVGVVRSPSGPVWLFVRPSRFSALKEARHRRR